MIFDALLSFFFGVFNGLMSLLPTFEIQVNFGGVVGDMFGYANEFVDLVALLIAIGALIGVFVAVEVFHLVVWILRKVRVLG